MNETKFPLIYNETHNNHTRIIPRDETFFHYSTDSFLYGLLLYEATYNPKENVLYLPVKVVREAKKIATKALETSERTIDRHFKDLIDKGYLEFSKQLGVWVITGDFSRYQKITMPALYFILTGLSKQALKIYVYLLNKYKWKKAENDKYYFSITELLAALEYKDTHNTATRNSVKRCLLTLCMLGAITITRVFKIEDDYAIPYFCLDFVGKYLDDFEPKKITELDETFNLSNPMRADLLPPTAPIVDDLTLARCGGWGE